MMRGGDGLGCGLAKGLGVRKAVKGGMPYCFSQGGSWAMTRLMRAKGDDADDGERPHTVFNSQILPSPMKYLSHQFTSPPYSLPINDFGGLVYWRCTYIFVILDIMLLF